MLPCIPSRRLLYAGAGVCALALLSPLWTPFAWLGAAGLALLAGLGVAEFLARPGAAVGVTRRLPELAHVGRALRYGIALENRSTRALVVELREALPQGIEGSELRRRVTLGPGEEAELAVECMPLERGALRLPAPGVRVSFPRGWLEFPLAGVPEDELRVAPGRPPGELAWLLSRAALLSEAGAKRLRRMGGDWEFESLRDYVPGDELRRIDWKASARRSLPRVREYEQERNAETVLALDCGRLMGTLVDGVEKLDLAMTPLLDLAAVSLRRGERVGLLVFDSRPRAWLPPRPGLQQLQRMIAMLAKLPSQEEPTSYLRAIAHLEARQRKRALVVVLTDFTDEVSAEELHASLAALARRHLLIFAAVADAHLARIFDERELDSEAVLFQRAAAGELLLERRRTLAAIERLGVIAVDAEPRRLSGPLIRRYIELRVEGAAAGRALAGRRRP
jgi:uncharacterized protein (DUF58 family)